MSETISGRRRVQEGDAISVPQDREHPGICPNRLPVPPHATEARPRGGLFPGPFLFATGADGAAGGPEKGALPVRPLFFRPCWVEEEEGAVEACCCCDRGTTDETPPRSAGEADDDPALDGPAEDLRGIFGGCNVC